MATPAGWRANNRVGRPRDREAPSLSGSAAAHFWTTTWLARRPRAVPAPARQRQQQTHHQQSEDQKGIEAPELEPLKQFVVWHR